MSTKDARRNNLNYLIQVVAGSQSALARQLESRVLTQQRLSELQCGRHFMRNDEAREIENKLGIPKKGLDQDGWVHAGQSYLPRYAQLSPGDKLLLDEIMQFVLDHS